MEIYKSKTVEEIQKFYGPILIQYEQHKYIVDHLKVLAQRMWEGVRSNHPWILKEFSNYHHDFLGKSFHEFKGIKIREEDCHQCVASQYGFQSLEILESINLTYDVSFERAVNMLVNGQLTELRPFLESEPQLVLQQSNYGHKATLLHYLAANGVEMWRQQTPLNAVEILILLIDAGCDLHAKMNVYGASFGFLELLESSDHPQKAGVQDQLARLYKSSL